MIISSTNLITSSFSKDICYEHNISVSTRSVCNYMLLSIDGNTGLL